LLVLRRNRVDAASRKADSDNEQRSQPAHPARDDVRYHGSISPWQKQRIASTSLLEAAILHCTKMSSKKRQGDRSPWRQFGLGDAGKPAPVSRLGHSTLSEPKGGRAADMIQIVATERSSTPI
jgi:hypothetical protein